MKYAAAVLLILIFALQAPAALKATDAPKPGTAEIQYFTELLARAETAPIKDFFHLWFPNDVAPVEKSYLDECVDLSKNEMVRLPDQSLAKRCQPDVLYSWGPDVKLKTIRKELVDQTSWNKALNGGRSVWMTISPVSTFSYGEIPIRFKFKATARYTHDGDENAVWDHTDGLMDFIMQNGSVLESYSFGMPQHYDEIIKDIRQFARSTNVVTYSGYRGSEPGYQNIYVAGVMERGAQDEATLRKSLTLMIRMILENKGEVHFAKGIKPSVKQHFATDHPTYFNEH